MSQTYGSDVVIETLRELGIEYAVINPGASFRGLHASLVNADSPELVLALHENVALATAHGYAMAAGKPMAVFLHNLVGLQSGAMGIFNAWVDQAPVMVVGGSGPADTTRRRPWIDWVHSTRTQSLVVRDYVKWDDQPVSVRAVPDSLRRAHRIATTAPGGPTYVAIDAALQEEVVDRADLPTRAPQASAPPVTTTPENLDRIADLLVRAQRPVIVADYVGKSRAGFEALQRLVETLACPVVDLMARFNVPTGHWADCTPLREAVLAEADVVLCLEVRDLSYAVGTVDHESHGVRALIRPDATVIDVGTNQLMLRGFIDISDNSMDAIDVIADTAACLPILADLVAERAGDRSAAKAALTERTDRYRRERAVPDGSVLDSAWLAAQAYRAVSATGPWLLANGLVRGQVREQWNLEQFNCHLGYNVGAGLGYGVGVSIGAALAHRGDDTLIVNLQNDGDFMYTPQGLWTQAHYNLPILTVMVNNRTYGQDLMHQSIIMKHRGQPASHAHVGIDINEPALDFATLARGQGVQAWGPVTDPAQLGQVLDEATKVVREQRRPALVDVVLPAQAPSA